MRLATLLLTCLATITVCFAAGTQPDDAARADKPALAVFLAVPDNGRDNNPIFLNDKSFHFHVIIKNVSAVPQKIWSDHCPWGWDNVKLEVLTIDGKTPQYPVSVERGIRQWASTAPLCLTLQPGEMFVRDVHLNVPRPDPNAKPGTSFGAFPNGPDYFGFLLPTHQQEKVSLCAVFAIAEGTSTRKQGVWSGRVISPVRTFTVEYRPSEPMF